MGCCSARAPSELELAQSRLNVPSAGSRYLLGSASPLFKSPRSTAERLVTLEPGAAFCIISDAGGGFFQIVPDKVDSGVGYLKLDAKLAAAGALRRLPSSRVVPGRYLLKEACTLREGPSSQSQELVEVGPCERSSHDQLQSRQVMAGQEVLLFELACHPRASGKCQVHARVKTQGRRIGWMPFNDEEISKLGAINLLGPDVATIGKAASEGLTSGRAPWQVGQFYRTLKEQPLLEEPVKAASPKELGRVPGGSLVQIQKAADTSTPELGRKLWLCISVADGKMSGSHGWLQSMEGSEYLIDIRAQWSEEKLVIEELLAAELAPMSALRTTKIGKVSGERASQPPLEVLGMDAQADSQPEHELEGHDRDIACGFCTCRLLPIGRLHPTVRRDHDAGLPPAPADSKALSTQDLRRWLTSVYSRFNPNLLPRVPEFMEKYQGKEPELVESVCGKYRVAAPPGWCKTG
ncbi:unnamed protein product [Symbiodinium pilosum]|uniref:Uncharacterized protein n=1 Tax=Symbiodinium pilosum TaxID=2952 RepID=A0A812X565_SYMPI|nr:unnamed protein product [Symbiodinium pilosum]